MSISVGIESWPRVRFDSPAAESLSEDDQHWMMCEQFNTMFQPDKETWLTTWYGPVGTPDRDEYDAAEEATLQAKLAKPGNLDMRGEGALVAEIQERRREAAVWEQAIIEVYVKKVVKFPKGTVVDVVPQPKKKSLYYREATRFLVLYYRTRTWGSNELELSGLFVDMMGVYLDAEGQMLQPAKDGNGRPFQPGEFQVERIPTNSNLSDAILGPSENQAHHVRTAGLGNLEPA